MVGLLCRGSRDLGRHPRSDSDYQDILGCASIRGVFSWDIFTHKLSAVVNPNVIVRSGGTQVRVEYSQGMADKWGTLERANIYCLVPPSTLENIRGAAEVF